MNKKGIILFGHGARNPQWAAPFHRIQDEIQRQQPAVLVSLAFLELMQPSLPTAVAAMVEAGVGAITIVPIFISAGGHVLDDLPRIAAEVMAEHPGLKVDIASPLGDAPEMITAMAAYALQTQGAAQTVKSLASSAYLDTDERLARIIAATNDGVWEYDLAAHRYSYLAPQAVAMLGEAQSQRMLADAAAAKAVIHPDDFLRVVEAFKQHIQQGLPYDVEMRICNDESSWFWVRSRGTVVRDAAGQAVALVGAMSNVNEAHLATDSLQRYQRLMRTVLDVMPEPVMVKDRDLHLLMVNRAYADRAGDEVEKLLGRDTREFMPQVEADRLVAADQAVLDSGRDQVFELSVPNRSQHMVRNYIVTKRIAYDENGQPLIVGTHHDVTDLKRSLAQFAAVIQETPLVAVQGFNRHCTVNHWNRASEELFAVPRARAIGACLQDLILEPRLQRPFTTMVERVWSDKRAFGPREVKLRLKDGRRIWLLMTVFPVLQDGAVVEVFSMAVDVTARHSAERKLAMHSEHLQEMVDVRTAGLQQAAHDLQLALQAKSEFLANMSHELRTPLHAILSFARLGEERVERNTPEKLRDYFARIVASGERLLLLINDLLDLSKLEAGKMPVQRAPNDLAMVVADVVSELAQMLQEKQLSVIQPDRQQRWLCDIDPVRMRQVLANLLSNAIRLSPEGAEITVTISASKIQKGRRASDNDTGPALLLSVMDAGPGIPEGELEIIFDKFVQSTKTRTGAGGTGLGLSICREIISAHDGQITARNNPQGGAIFDVLLPVSAPCTAAPC